MKKAYEKQNTPRYAQKSKTPEQALAALMRYAAKAERSSGDARRLMMRWEVAEQDQVKILAQLQREKFIDDVRFADAYVRDKIQFAGWGIHKVRGGLKQKGIAPDIISRALEQMCGEGESGERLQSLLERKARSVKGDTPYDRKAKLIRFGLSRGFEYDEVMDAADKIIIK